MESLCKLQVSDLSKNIGTFFQMTIVYPLYVKVLPVSVYFSLSLTPLLCNYS